MMNWFLLIAFGAISIALPTMMMCLRHVIPLHMKFVLGWMWLGALMVLPTAVARMLTWGSPEHVNAEIVGFLVTHIFLVYSLVLGIGLLVRKLVIFGRSWQVSK